METRDFFVSYTKADREWALWVADTLVRHGHSVYIQAWDSPPGENFLEWINGAIEHSENFIAVWTGAYAASEHCRGEFETEYLQKIHGNIRLFLPVRMENVPLKPLYQRFGYVDLFRVYNTDRAEAERVLIHAVEGTAEARPEPPVRESTRGKIADWMQKNARQLIFITFILVVFYIFYPILLWAVGKIYYNLENYTEAQHYYELAAENDNPAALNHLGWLYRNGLGVEVDYDKARDFYEQATAKGDAAALNHLGWFYQNGLGVDVDYDMARNYYEQAAAKGSASALCNLGYLYQNGLGVDVDYDMERNYYEQAAAKNNTYAYYNLGRLYETGQGVKINLEKALEYYQKAVDLGYEAAPAKVAEIQAQLSP